MKVSVVENVLKLNDELAAINRQRLRDAGTRGVDLIGAPGCGKTALIEATVPRLADCRAAIIVGDMATQRDADRMARVCDQVVQVNTGRGCHLEAHHVRQALQRIDLRGVELLLIENVGNLICPVGFDLGQDAKVGLFSVAEGDDKPAKHPYLVTEAKLILLTKIDLLPHVTFSREVFYADVRRLNRDVPVIECSIRTGEGLDAWTQWLRSVARGA